MTEANRKRLDELYGFWRTLRDAQYLRGLNVHEKADMLRILREEFWPGYTYDEWCSSCVADMVRTLYTRYDKWLSEQPPPEPEPIIVAASFPVNDKPEITVREATPEESESIIRGLDELAQSIDGQLKEYKPPKKNRRRK